MGCIRITFLPRARWLLTLMALALGLGGVQAQNVNVEPEQALTAESASQTLGSAGDGREMTAGPGLAHQVAVGLTSFGPRPMASSAHDLAEEWLLDRMKAAGLVEVAVEDDGHTRNLVGILPGRSTLEVVVSAHYDTVAQSPGAQDDASGCGVALAVAAELAEWPREHTLRVVLFDGEEKGLLGSRAWVNRLASEQREKVLASLNVEMVGWKDSHGPVLHTFSITGPTGHRRVAPGWLVHAVLQASEAIEWPLAVADSKVSVLAQLALRTTQLRHYSDSDSLLSAGIPSLLLSDSSLLAFDPAYHSADDGASRLQSDRLDQWTTLVAATVRRLDSLPGRPRDDDQYLALGQRVVHRRQLLWGGFILWAALVFRGIPGAWRNTDGETRRSRGKTYFARFGFRVTFLLTLFLAPTLSLLLFPAAVVVLLRSVVTSVRVLQSKWVFVASLLLGWLPSLAYAAALCLAWSKGFVASLELGATVSVLLVASLLAFSIMIRPRKTP